MKKLWNTLLCFLLVASAALYAQDKPVKIVFDVTSDNVKTQESAIRHVKMMSKAYPESQFEVVMYGGSVNMVLPGKSTVSEDIKSLAENSNVEFKVCEGTLNRHKIDKSMLIPGVTTVPDGIIEIVTKQGEGWGYIKEGGN